VRDKTGLAGGFDFVVYSDDDGQADSGPSIFTAVQEQLGLRLEAAKGPVEVLVVESRGKAVAELKAQHPRTSGLRYPQGMATPIREGTAASLEEYLRTSFPGLDREYRDGEIVERSLPDPFHSRTQILIGFFFEALRKRLSVFAYSELRLKLREGLVLIPDICVYWPERQTSRLPDVPPLVAIEILSPDDRLTAAREKLEEYRAWGVKHVWLVDPYSRRMYRCEPGLTEVATLALPEIGVELRPDDIFE
jgi:Uma2 family endonuclease